MVKEVTMFLKLFFGIYGAAIVFIVVVLVYINTIKAWWKAIDDNFYLDDDHPMNLLNLWKFFSRVLCPAVFFFTLPISLLVYLLNYFQ